MTDPFDEGPKTWSELADFLDVVAGDAWRTDQQRRELLSRRDEIRAKAPEFMASSLGPGVLGSEPLLLSGTAEAFLRAQRRARADRLTSRSSGKRSQEVRSAP